MYEKIEDELFPDLPVRILTRIGEVHTFQPRYNGPAYDPGKDFARLHAQTARIKDLMLDGEWRSLHEIAESTGDPEASVSAQLRHLRKPRFGSYRVEKRRRGDGGTFEYRVGL